MKLEPRAGFTLIELLVVISIIAILSAVVLGALGSARQKGQYAAAQQSLIQLRNTYELQYLSLGNSYSSLMPAGILGVSGTPLNSSPAGHYTCNTNTGASPYNNYCAVYDAVGCQGLFGSGSINNICTDIFNKVGSTGTFYFGVIGSASIIPSADDYAFAVTNPSSPSSVFCIRSSGSVITTSSGYSTCLTKTFW